MNLMLGWSQMDLTAWLPVAVFGLVGAIAWLLLDQLAPKREKWEERLDRFQRGDRGGRGGENDGRLDGFARWLNETTPVVAKPLKPINEKEENQLRQRLSAAGFRGENAMSVLLSLKLVLLLIGLVFGGGWLALKTGFAYQPVLRCVFVAGVLFYVPDLVLSWLTKQRQEQIFLSLPDALDLLVVCVEAGLGLDQAFQHVSDEMKKSHRVIAEEFNLCNLQRQMGKPREQVLQELGQRNQVDDLRTLATILIQADRFGSSIGQALRVQSDSMRTRRRQLAEERAAKTAVKLIFPLVLFIFPGIFVVLVGPATIRMIHDLFPVMSGQ